MANGQHRNNGRCYSEDVLNIFFRLSKRIKIDKHLAQKAKEQHCVEIPAALTKLAKFEEFFFFRISI